MSRVAQRRHPSDMNEDSLNDVSQQWVSITGQPLDLGLHGPGFPGQCVSIASYEKLNRLGEGTYGVVYRARNRQSSRVVALKQVRISEEERQNGVPITAIREISILRSLKHNNIIDVIDVAVGAHAMDEVYMVMEYAEQDLANMVDQLNVEFTISQVKCLFRQILEGIDYLHMNDIIHRDVKMQNILLTAKGVLKLADFGMARAYSPRPLTPGVSNPLPNYVFAPYFILSYETQRRCLMLVVTIWYRAPEILLGTKYYNSSVDLWSAGLVLAELLQSAPCLTGETPIEQLSLITKLLGSPSQDDLAALSAMGCPELIRWRREGLALGRADNLDRRFLANTSPETVAFLRGLLRWDPNARWTAGEALGIGKSRFAATAGNWWKESPRAIDKGLLPTFPEVRNAEAVQNMANHGKSHVEKSGHVGKKNNAGNGEYVFDFGEESSLQRPAKRPRAR